jgi:hypothetical protein
VLMRCASWAGSRAGAFADDHQVVAMNTAAAIMQINVNAIAMRCESVSCQRSLARVRRMVVLRFGFAAAGKPHG